MVILFLDFDGVMHPIPIGFHQPFCRMDILERAILPYMQHVQIVIASSWKMDLPIEKMREVFPASIRHLVIGTTPHIDWDFSQPEAPWRHREVLLWLEQNGQKDMPWIAVDDKARLYPDLENVILTNSETGLDQAAVAKISVLLAKHST